MYPKMSLSKNNTLPKKSQYLIKIYHIFLKMTLHILYNSCNNSIFVFCYSNHFAVVQLVESLVWNVVLSKDITLFVSSYNQCIVSS